MDSRRPLQLGESYAFECTRCGECCRGDIRISLNLLDLWHMAGFLGFPSTARLFEDGWVGEESLEKGGFRPFIRFREKPMRFCPFLENRLEDDGTLLGLCRLHPDRKPLVCNLAPLGREVQLPDLEAWFFTEPIEGCPGCRESTQCQPRQVIEPLRRDLALERRYFQVMETLQQTFADDEVFRRFHRELRVEGSVEDYLSRWLSRVGVT